jgi:nicotinamide mononucleotide adenylyltransferase
MMLGRWQPWHKGHQELFKKALERTGQVIIMIRSMPNSKDKIHLMLNKLKKT